MTHASLFSGIGGFDLAAQWMGWENVFQVEIDPFCQKILAKNFPKVERFTDIKKFYGGYYKGKVDVISGGFPCQPFSLAGKRRGKEDDRYLWEEMLRVIGDVRPSFVVGENVAGIINLALDTVLSDLEGQGYTTETFVIPACAVNAPHRRDRVWIIAYTNNKGGSTGFGQVQSTDGEISKRYNNAEFSDTSNEFTTDTGSYRSQRGIQSRCDEKQNRNKQNVIIEECLHTYKSTLQTGGWQNFPTQSPVCGRNDGVSNRVDRLKALGNAIVPQVAYEIFKAIELINE